MAKYMLHAAEELDEKIPSFRVGHTSLLRAQISLRWFPSQVVELVA